MKVLYGSAQVGTILDFLNSQKPSDFQIDHVDTREHFKFRLQEPYDKIVVYCNLFYDVYPWDWVVDLRSANPEAKILIVLDEQIYDSMLLDVIYRLSDDLKCSVVPIGLSEIEAAEQLARFMFDQSAAAAEQTTIDGNGRVVAIWPAASKDGASTIAINTAIALSTLSELNIGLLDLNLKNPEIRADLNISDRNMNINKLRPKLLTQTLEPADLLNACVSIRKLDRLHILAGTHRRDTALDVSPEMVQHLLSVAKHTFDITIVDVHTFPDNAATVCSVRNADHRWLVSQNNYASYKLSWGDWYDCFWRHCGIQTQDIQLIVNRVGPQDKPSLVAEHMGLDLIATIPNAGGGLGLKSVQEGVPLYYQPQNAPFVESINMLASQLASSIGVSVQLSSKKKQSWLQRIAASFLA